jgi:hypothetical protein
MYLDIDLDLETQAGPLLLLPFSRDLQFILYQYLLYSSPSFTGFGYTA